MTSDERLAPGRPDASEDPFYAALVEDDPEELYDNAPCAYLSTLPDGTIVKVNRTFLGWTGYDRASLVGHRRFQELLAPGDRIFHETHFSPLLRLQGQVREIAVEVVCRQGRHGGGGDQGLVTTGAPLSDGGPPTRTGRSLPPAGRLRRMRSLLRKAPKGRA